MISLRLWDNVATLPTPLPSAQRPTLEEVEGKFHQALGALHSLLGEVRRSTIVIPSDVLMHAHATLFPPERMSVIAGRPLGGGIILGAAYDVTGTGRDTNRVHVRAEPRKLAQALMGFEFAGVRLSAWMHSHPGSGPLATHPSMIDVAQFRGWTVDFPDLVALIIVADGFVRIWGDAVESGRLRPEISGPGVERIRGEDHVYRLAI